VGIGPVQREVVQRIIAPGMVVATIGRLSVRDRSGSQTYFDSLAEFLQVEIVSIDVSARDGDINRVANLNLLQDWGTLERNVDVILDMGSLEHISNLPNALENYHRLLKPGGTIFFCNPANNYVGHGLFQFGPEFFYRLFDSVSGYRAVGCFIEKKLAAPLTSKNGFRSVIYRAPDPATHARRLMFQNRSKAQILFLAQKIEHRPLSFDFVQSDYGPEFSKASSPPRQRFLRFLIERVFRRSFRVFRKAVRSSRDNRLGSFPWTKIRHKEWEQELDRLRSISSARH
jgi:SAM-dependent methyltransferase